MIETISYKIFDGFEIKLNQRSTTTKQAQSKWMNISGGAMVGINCFISVFWIIDSMIKL